MKLSKIQWIIVIAVVAIAVYYFFFREDKDDQKESGYVKTVCFGKNKQIIHDGPCGPKDPKGSMTGYDLRKDA